MIDLFNGVILFLLLILIGIAARALWMLTQVKAQIYKSLKSTHTELLAHIQTPGLHRNGDSDARVTQLEARLSKVEDIAGRIL